MSEYRGGHVILSPSESNVFRQILSHPNDEAITMRDASLKQASEMQFRMTPTGFTFTLPDPPPTSMSAYFPNNKKSVFYSATINVKIIKCNSTAYDTEDFSETYAAINYYVPETNKNLTIRYGLTTADINIPSKLVILDIAA